MLKKVTGAVILLCLILCMGVVAVNAVNETVPEVQEGTFRTPQGGRGNMGTPPSFDMQGQMPSGMPGGQMPSGDFTLPEGFTPPQNAEGFMPQRSENQAAETAAPVPSDAPAAEETPQTPDESAAPGAETGGNMQFGGQMPGNMGGFSRSMQTSQNGEAQTGGFWGFVKTYSAPVVSVLLLGLAFIFVIFYRRKNY